MDKIKKGYDKFGRMCKDLYFMNLAFNVAKRSLDPNTKCGCVFIDKDGGILSTGYNGPVRNSIDSEIPLQAPLKYDVFEHSERNGIYQAAKHGVSLDYSILYVTGLPCIDCIRGIIQSGTKKVIYGPLQAVMTSTRDYLERFDRIVKNINIRIQRFEYDNELYELNPEIKEICESRKQVYCQW